MLSRQYRFPLSTEFGRIKREGQMINGFLFGLLIAKQTSTNQSGKSEGSQVNRFGFVISTKIDKRAVVRHRVKRLLSEAVRANLEKIKHGYDFVFLVKKPIVGKSLVEIKKEMEVVFTRANLIN